MTIHGKQGPGPEFQRAREKVFREELASVTDFKNVFETKQGSRVLSKLMRDNFMLDTTFAATPHEMAMREGARNVILQILSKLETHPEQLRELIKESMHVGGGS